MSSTFLLLSFPAHQGPSQIILVLPQLSGPFTAWKSLKDEVIFATRAVPSVKTIGSLVHGVTFLTATLWELAFRRRVRGFDLLLRPCVQSRCVMFQVCLWECPCQLWCQRKSYLHSGSRAASKAFAPAKINSKWSGPVFSMDLVFSLRTVTLDFGYLAQTSQF